MKIELNPDEVKAIDEALTCLSNRYYYLSLSSLNIQSRNRYKQKEIQLCRINHKIKMADLAEQMENQNES